MKLNELAMNDEVNVDDGVDERLLGRNKKIQVGSAWVVLGGVGVSMGRGGAGVGDKPPSPAPWIDTRPHPRPIPARVPVFGDLRGYMGTRGYPWVPIKTYSELSNFTS